MRMFLLGFIFVSMTIAFLVTPGRGWNSEMNRHLRHTCLTVYAARSKQYPASQIRLGDAYHYNQWIKSAYHDLSVIYYVQLVKH